MISWRTLVAVLLGLSVLFVAPAFIHGYIYPTGGDDTASHLIYFQNMDTQNALYWGQWLAGKLVNGLPFDSVATFSVFNYAAFVLMIWAIGISLALSVNWFAGVLAAILVTFGIRIALDQFWSGAIFNLINVGILLPLFLLCLHKKRNGGNRFWLLGMLIFGGMFGAVHPTGLYMLALIPFILAYEIFRAKVLKREVWGNRYLVYIGGLIVAIGFAFALDLAHPNSERLLADMVLLIAVLAAGILASLPMRKPFPVLIVILLCLWSIPNISLWFQDNSAVKEADKAVITYLNGLSGKTYTASPEVAEQVYCLFLNKQFVNGKADYAVVRSVSMTCGSDSESQWFRNAERIGFAPVGYNKIAEFGNYGVVVISLYEKVSP